MAKDGPLPDACVAFTVVILNIICGLLGAVIFCLAVWMRVEDNVREWVVELGMYQYWNGLYILMAAGALIMLISICGCLGAINGSRCLLGTSAAFIIVAFILELAGGIYILANGTKYSKLDPWLERKFYKLILDSNYNDRANLALQAIQEKVGCCGSVNYMDYDRARLPIADHCRDAVTGNVYQEGCVKKFSNFIELRAGWIAGIALFVGFLQLLLIILTIMRCRSVDDDDEGAGFTMKRKYDPVATSSQ